MQKQASNRPASSSSKEQALDAHDHHAQERNEDGKWKSVSMSGEKKKGKRLHKKSGSNDEYEDEYNDADDSENDEDYVDINQIHADRGKISKEEEKLRRKHQRDNGTSPGAYSSNLTSTRESRKKSSQRSRRRSTSSDRDDLAQSSHNGDNKRNVPGAHASNLTSTRESRKSSQRSRRRSTSSDRDDLARSSHNNGDKNNKNNVPGAHASNLTSTRESRKTLYRSRSCSHSMNPDELALSNKSSNHYRNRTSKKTRHLSMSSDRDELAQHTSSPSTDRELLEARKASSHSSGATATRQRSKSSDRDDLGRSSTHSTRSPYNDRDERIRRKMQSSTASTSSTSPVRDRVSEKTRRESAGRPRTRKRSDDRNLAVNSTSKMDEEDIQVMGETIEDDRTSAPTPPIPPQSNQNDKVEQNNTKEVVVQSSQQVNNNDKSHRQKHLYFAALLLVAAVTAAVTWFLTSSIGDNSNSPLSMELLFDPPSTNDCVSIAGGESLPNQTLSRNFELPLDVVLLDSDSKMEDHMHELMAAIQRHLIPSLAGCFVDEDLAGRRLLGSLESKYTRTSATHHHRALKSSPSIRFAILNAIATGEYRGDEMCDQASEDFCHRVSLYLTVFLKGDIEISEVVNLVLAEGFDDRGMLVDRLRLENPFGNVYIRGVNNMSPTPPPSAAPSGEPEPLVYDPPSVDDCRAIAKNYTVEGRETKEQVEFGLDFEVTLADNLTLTYPLKLELLDAIQEIILPSLAGCNIREGRAIEPWRYVIFDAFVKGDELAEQTCEDDSTEPDNSCSRLFVDLTLFIKGKMRFLDLLVLIVGESNDKSNLKSRLGLGDAFSIVMMTEAEIATPTASPSTAPSMVPSLSPSQTPSFNPTTNRPEVDPTNAPTRRQTTAPSMKPAEQSPSESPIASPTSLPVMVPSTRPVSPPSTRPPSSMSATEPPSTGPSSLPSTSPSRIPSDSPSRFPSESPSTLPSRSPSESPSTVPTVKPSNVPTTRPSLVLITVPSPGVDYAQVGQNLKCPFNGGFRVLMIENSNVDDCYQSCLNDESCVLFTFKDTTGFCIGCSIGVAGGLEAGDGFAAYEMTGRVPSLPVGVDYVQVGQNLKCPRNGDFRVLTIENSNLYYCFQTCLRNESCVLFTFKDTTGFCIGCSIGVAGGLEADNGFGAYEMTGRAPPVPDLDYVQVGQHLKCPVDGDFRVLSIQNSNLYYCFQTCLRNESCVLFSYRDTTGHCIGCSIGVERLVHDDDFGAYEMIGRTAAPTTTPFDPGFVLMQADVKCPAPARFREFSFDSNGGDVNACYEACLAVEACVAFSVSGNLCIGCNIAVEWFQSDTAATGYAMTARSTPITNPILIGHNLKCPNTNNRLFHLDYITTYDGCRDACLNTEGCASFSLVTYSDGQKCSGCPFERSDELEPQSGSSTYRLNRMNPS